MDELTKVRELRDEVPAPDQGRLAAGRTRLLAEARGPRARRRGRRRLDWRLAAAGTVLAVTGAAVLAVNLGEVGQSAGGLRPAASAPAVPGNPDQVLEQAARAVEGSAAEVPRDDQWIYTKTVEQPSSGSSGDVRSLGPQETEKWQRWADPDFENGKEGDDRSMREQAAIIAGLPVDPQGVLAAARAAYTGGGGTQDEHSFAALSVLTGSPVARLDGPGLAKMYRALDSLPGVEVVEHLVKDAAGRDAIAIGMITGSEAATRQEILLDPETYLPVGHRLVVIKDYEEEDPLGVGGNPPMQWKAGDIRISSAKTGWGVVEHRGERP
ncbi:CU044_5270 family protein [Streptomyces sp. NPDC050418]|uniref:CU044_5270 family protein n=1 Tax=Streptomyces sp. NPDC050418 TaxID=3365612 RepID=UPI0037AF46EA